jgi:hypothetical protein
MSIENILKILIMLQYIWKNIWDLARLRSDKKMVLVQFCCMH